MRSCPVYYKVFSAISYFQYIIWAGTSSLQSSGLPMIILAVSVLGTSCIRTEQKSSTLNFPFHPCVCPCGDKLRKHLSPLLTMYLSAHDNFSRRSSISALPV